MECDEKPVEAPGECRKRLEDFMREAAERVKAWPEWKRSRKHLDRDRQNNRYEPKPKPLQGKQYGP